MGCGCFWSKQYYLDQLKGVISTHVGFAGGSFEAPSYRHVCQKKTGHAEVVLVNFDPKKLALKDLLAFFFSLHDATIDRRLKGGQYRSLIGLTQKSKSTKDEVEKILDQIRNAGHDIKTDFHPKLIFHPAEGRHQQYCETRSIQPQPPKGSPFSI